MIPDRMDEGWQVHHVAGLLLSDDDDACCGMQRQCTWHGGFGYGKYYYSGSGVDGGGGDYQIRFLLSDCNGTLDQA